MSVRRLSNSTISSAGRGRSSSMIAGYSPAVDEMDLIARVTVGPENSSGITFSNIPQTYQHLQIRAVSRGTSAGSSSTGLGIRYNSDSGNNYTTHRLYGTGSSAVSASSVSSSSASIANHPHDTTLTNVYAAMIVNILDYTSTSKTKVSQSFNGHDLNGSGLVLLDSQLWNNTSAINSIYIFDGSSGLPPIKQYSVYSLYGVVG